MTEVVFHGISLQCVRGDIANQPDVDAIVNAANAQLRPGAGVAGAIHKAAGPELDRECRSLAPIRPGQAVITSAHGLPNRYVVHCLGPVYGKDTPSSALLASCYSEALQLADRRDAASIAFPAISTGVFGYPLEDAATIALKTTIDTMPSLTSVRLIRFVLFTASDLQIFEDKLHELVHRAHET
jgi:O-acetyl-ADP-ribose deacetylase (regulator of RNase III)